MGNFHIHQNTRELIVGEVGTIGLNEFHISIAVALFLFFCKQGNKTFADLDQSISRVWKRYLQ